MFRLTLILCTAIIVSSCHKSSGIKEVIISSDSAAINFFKGDGSMDTVIKVVIIRDKKQLDQLAGFADSDIKENYKCGYDGSLHFFKMGKVIQDIDFRMNDVQCMHFTFKLSGEIFSTSLSPEAKQFIELLKK